MISKICPVEYDPNADLDLWGHFLVNTLDGDKEMIVYLLKALGYNLKYNPCREVIVSRHYHKSSQVVKNGQQVDAHRPQLISDVSLYSSVS
jgi:hypothetical protein